MHYLTDPTSEIPTIGASGAISGVLGAYAWVIIGFWFIMQLIFGTMSLVGGVGSGIAFWAHISGFIFGYGITRIFVSKKR